MTAVTTPRTQLEPHFDPQRVRAMTTEQELDVSIGGSTLAAHALRAGIVDDVHLFTSPIVVGGGTSCWPAGAKVALDLVEQSRFADGTVHCHYRTRRTAS